MVHSLIPWQDRFRVPDVRDLRKPLEEDATGAFDRLRSRLQGIDGVEEVPAWYGTNWCWSLEYRRAGTEAPIAILIPSPDDVQMAMPVDEEFLEALPHRRLKRAIRDGLELAQAPFDTTLAVWSMLPTTIVDDLLDILDRRLKYLETADAD